MHTTVSNVYSRHKKIFAVLFVLFAICLIVIIANFFVVQRYTQYIVLKESLPTQSNTVGIVLGAGVVDGKPRPTLKDRLDTAAALLKAGKIRKLVVSGDNRFVNYNEPQAMKDYLVNQKDINPDKVQLDNAGRSTYESCERAKKIFGLEKTILISQSTHLPRAIFLCRSFGIEAYGVSSDNPITGGKAGQLFREIFARSKATINVYIIGEKTVLGAPIKI